MIMKLGMEHYKLKLYTFYINDDPELTLTNFKTMSILEKLVFVLIHSSTKYQVSVYRTIGPLIITTTATIIIIVIIIIAQVCMALRNLEYWREKYRVSQKI